MLTFTRLISDPIPDHEQKQVALTYLHEAWAEANLDGVDGDCMAQACLFRALSELIGTYGEDATAHFTESLSNRIKNGEFSIPRRTTVKTTRSPRASRESARARPAQASSSFLPTSRDCRARTYRPASRSRSGRGKASSRRATRSNRW